MIVITSTTIGYYCLVTLLFIQSQPCLHPFTYSQHSFKPPPFLQIQLHITYPHRLLTINGKTHPANLPSRLWPSKNTFPPCGGKKSHPSRPRLCSSRALISKKSGGFRLASLCVHPEKGMPSAYPDFLYRTGADAGRFDRGVVGRSAADESVWAGEECDVVKMANFQTDGGFMF